MGLWSALLDAVSLVRTSQKRLYIQDKLWKSFYPHTNLLNTVKVSARRYLSPVEFPAHEGTTAAEVVSALATSLSWTRLKGPCEHIRSC